MRGRKKVKIDSEGKRNEREKGGTEKYLAGDRERWKKMFTHTHTHTHIYIYIYIYIYIMCV